MERMEQDPEQQSRREAFKRSDIASAVLTRQLISERVRHPSERESGEAIALITSEVLNSVLKDYVSIDTLKLKEFKEIASRKYGYPLSAPHLSSLIISRIAGELQSEATEVFKNNAISSISILSICAYDLGRGILEVTSTIEDAENVLRGTYDKAFGDTYDEEIAGAVSRSDEADYFLAQKAKALKYSKLLKEDPTGRSLVRHAVEEIENPQEEPVPCLREFVVHGARFAENAYGIVYPLAQKINKPI